MNLRQLGVLFLVVVLGGLTSTVVSRVLLPPVQCTEKPWITDEDLKQLERLFGGRGGSSGAKPPPKLEMPPLRPLPESEVYHAPR